MQAVRLEQLLQERDERGRWTASRLAKAASRHLPRGKTVGPSTITRLRRDEGTRGDGGGRRQTRTASLTLALAIELATDGRVRAEDLPLSRESRRLLKQLRQAQEVPPANPPDSRGGSDAARHDEAVA